MKGTYENLNSTFRVISLLSDDTLGIVMAELEMEGRRSVDVFEAKDNHIIRKREYYDGIYWSDEYRKQSIISMKIELDSNMLETIKRIARMFSSVESWALDGSTSLALQGIEVQPHDIDILTDKNGAHQIQDILRGFMEKPLSHTSDGRHDSHFGITLINGIRVEIMGDLKTFRNGRWSETQNPKTLKTKIIKIQETPIPVISIESQLSTGYLMERLSGRVKNQESKV